ncbi:MAG: DNA glycosylase [Sphingomonas sp. 28-66-16]|nr:MAG: DNA glycosylase [Sphingomonas sp. 28-66-16]
MGLTADHLKSSLDAIAAIEPAMAAAIDRAGYPPPRIRERGYATLLRTIVGQQVSVAAAQSIWTKLEAGLGDLNDPATLAAISIEEMRGFGLSRQKASYAHSLAEQVTSGQLDLQNLSPDDEEAIAALSSVKGIGRWSAEIYLLFAEGRGDIWPAGDLAVQIEIGRILGLDARPTEKATRLLADPWRPHRGAAAIMAWHHYKVDMAVV